MEEVKGKMSEGRERKDVKKLRETEKKMRSLKKRIRMIIKRNERYKEGVR